MKRLERIITLLKEVKEDSPSHEINVAKGKYKYPHTLKEIYRMEKRHLKYRNSGRKNG